MREGLAADLAYLRSVQDASGAWGFHTGGLGFTQATGIGLVLAASRPELAGAAGAAVTWLQGQQHRDGGWGALAGDRESCWTTAWAVWALSAAARGGISGVRPEAVAQGLAWLLGNRSASVRVPPGYSRIDGTLVGWPWTAGTFGWVIPTAITLAALRSAGASAQNAGPVSEAAAMLVNRACSGGGWNFGNPTMLAAALAPTPPETAMALIGLSAAAAPALGAPATPGLAYLERALAAPPTLGALTLAWGVLALRLTGRDASPAGNRLLARRQAGGGWQSSPRTTALAILALDGELGSLWPA